MTNAVVHRRALHQIPELVTDLPKTLAYVRSVLEPLACELTTPTTGSLCAYFDYGQPTTVALRADMDALPVTEVNQVVYGSQHPGQMHACGHDGHMGILLEVAQRLNREKRRLARNVLLIFQPAEETEGGAEPLCQSGILKQYQVDRLFGLHLWPKVEQGVIFSRPGALMARANEVDVHIVGKSVHISRAEEGLDALGAGMDVLQRVNQFMAEMPSEIPRKMGFGKMTSGTVRNALSGETVLEGSLRTYTEETFHHCKEGFQAIGREVAEASGCQVTVSFSDGYPAVWNPEDFYQEICQALGDKAPKTLDAPVLAAEDFSFYQQSVPAIFFFLGLGETPELHAHDFQFDDEVVLPKGVDFFMELVGLGFAR